MTTQETLTIELSDQKATEDLARALAALVKDGEQLALQGDLGVGKTVFARAFIGALCGADTEVPSPTFTLVQTYEAIDGRMIFHFDMYRLKDPDEALELDIDDAFYDAISLIEWPEKLGYLLPRDHLLVALSYGDEQTQRSAHVKGLSNWSKRIKGLSLEP